MDAWAPAPDWNALLQLNLLFIRGEVDVNPNHLAPLNEESMPLVPGLIELHKYGILTCNSQPFEKSSQFITGEGWLQKRQRPYLHFMLPTLHPDIDIVSVDDLIESLFADKTILVSVYSECDGYSRTSDRMECKRLVPLTPGLDRDTYDFRTNAFWNKEAVTTRRRAKTFKGLTKKACEECTFFPYTSVAFLTLSTDQCGCADDDSNFKAATVMRPLAIGIMAWKWGSDLDLQDLLRRHCEEAGLKNVLNVESRIGRQHMNFDGQGGSECSE
ncbi:hypothetical protein J4E86_004336 [Alternaria arbusti]|uniref:uncharacterized protein n=1 Tax=Alternaria arbusti TaxID=232088 RepID=UPI00221F3513|nr:uncharacterized protein J4E86_004336 [Alternaria arbusti]KAI4958731.1 hypothetical protein J4E86_004336 [Alternaria arbusti]